MLDHLDCKTGVSFFDRRGSHTALPLGKVPDNFFNDAQRVVARPPSPPSRDLLPTTGRSMQMQARAGRVKKWRMQKVRAVAPIKFTSVRLRGIDEKMESNDGLTMPMSGHYYSPDWYPPLPSARRTTASCCLGAHTPPTRGHWTQSRFQRNRTSAARFRQRLECTGNHGAQH